MYKMLLQSHEEDIKQVALTILLFGDFCRHSVKVGPIFSSFNPCPSLSSEATDKSGKLFFEIQFMEKHVLAFYKDNKERERYKRKYKSC